MLVQALALAAAALALVVFALATVVGVGFVCPRPGAAHRTACLSVIDVLRCLALVRRWLDLGPGRLLAGHGAWQCVRPL